MIPARRLPKPVLVALAFFLLSPGVTLGQFDCAITQFTDQVDAGFGGGSLSSGSPWMALSGSGLITRGSSYEVYRANLLTGGLDNVTNAPGYDGNPAINADGTRIAFESETNLTGGNPDGNREIVWVDVTTSRLIQLSDSTGSGNFRPKIDATGTKILFHTTNDLVGENPNHQRQAFLYDINQGALLQLTHLASGLSNVRMNSSASLLVFDSEDDPTGDNPEGNSEIFLLDIANGKLTQITQTTEGRNSGPSVSDDGGRIAFGSDSEDLIGDNPDGLPEVVFYDRCSGSFTQLSNVSSNTFGAMMTPDGNRVLANLNHSVVLYDVRVGVQEVVVTPPGINGYGTTSPDGRLFSIRSNADLTGDNPDLSFEVFLASCTGLSLFADGFECGDFSSWSISVGSPKVVPGITGSL